MLSYAYFESPGRTLKPEIFVETNLEIIVQNPKQKVKIFLDGGSSMNCLSQPNEMAARTVDLVNSYLY